MTFYLIFVYLCYPNLLAEILLTEVLIRHKLVKGKTARALHLNKALLKPMGKSILHLVW